MKVAWSQFIGYLIIFCFGIIGGVIGMSLLKKSRPAAILIVPPEPTATIAPTTTPFPTATAGPMHVYVSGAVEEAGVYLIEVGGIVADGVSAAGGMTHDANQDVANLAIAVYEGMHIYIPYQSEGVTAPELPEAEEKKVSQPSGGLGKIDINRASMEELQSLPGIGPSSAEKIIFYREEHGLFKGIEELMNVSGIGPAKFEQLSGWIEVGE